jgi:hypothetical protein
MQLQPTTTAGSTVHRIKTLATRVTPAEMAAVEAAAASSGATRSEWLRACALANLQRPHQSPRISLESTILEEIMALRYLVINFFSMANLGTSLQTLHGAMAIADKGKRGAAVRALDSPGENPTP